MIALERGQLWVMRIHAVAAGLVAVALAVVGEAVLRAEIGVRAGVVIVPMLIVLVYPVLIAPGRKYQAWGYRMEHEELRIARGTWNRTETLVPLVRVQHIDISQGPLERGFGVSRLVLHTAGTMNSRVVLPGLARPTAEAMRDAIRAHIRRDEP